MDTSLNNFWNCNIVIICTAMYMLICKCDLNGHIYAICVPIWTNVYVFYIKLSICRIWKLVFYGKWLKIMVTETQDSFFVAWDFISINICSVYKFSFCFFLSRKLRLKNMHEDIISLEFKIFPFTITLFSNLDLSKFQSTSRAKSGWGVFLISHVNL